MSLQDVAAATVETARTATPPPEPATGTPPAEAAPASEPAKVEAAPTLFFRKKEEKPAVDLSTLDPSKLPPDVQPFYKSMQADYTRKTQALADERKKLEAEMAANGATRKMFEDFLSKVAEGRTATDQPPKPDPMEQIKALRENGDHEAADRLLMEVWSAEQKAATEPLRREAEMKNLQATFRETATATIMNDPIVQQYKDYVVKTFDAENPTMTRLRQDILSDPERTRFYVPMVLRMLAYESHIQNIENALETKVETLVQERIKAERAKAAGLPKSLVSSGSVSMEGERPKMNLQESISAAMETLRSQ